MKLIVGLGNPGKKYEKTRHNVGFVVLEALQTELHALDEMGVWKEQPKFESLVAEGHSGGRKVLLAKPQTFMNNSGAAVTKIADYYDIKPIDILIVHDDKDIELGEVRDAFERGHGGQNGVRSVIERLGSKSFHRLRVGVKTKLLDRKGTSDFVLGRFGIFDKIKLKGAIEHSLDAAHTWITS